VCLPKGVVSAALGVDGWRDDERRGVRGGVVVRSRWLSTSRLDVVGPFLDRLIHCRRKVTDRAVVLIGTDRAVVLIGGETACDMDAVEQALAGCDLGECGRRGVAVGVDPESGPIIEE